MKFIYAFSITYFVFLPIISFGQDHGFMFDENGKITFTEVVEIEGQREALLEKIENLLEGSNEVSQEGSSEVIVQDGFLLYQHSIGKTTEGRIDYTLKVEVKDNRYRYTVQHFIFTPYFRNRYGRFEAKRGESQPLERLLSKKNKRWERHFAKVREKISIKSGGLKTAMASTKLPKEQKIVKLKDDW